MTTNYNGVTGIDGKENPAVAAVPHIITARAIVRTVALAADALKDGSVQYEDQAGPQRWSAAVAKALEHMSLASDALLNAPIALGVDWPTPYALVDALDAALWQSGQSAFNEKMQRLTADELVSAAVAAVESLDTLLRQCAAAGDVHEAQRPEPRSMH